MGSQPSGPPVNPFPAPIRPVNADKPVSPVEDKESE